MARMAVLLSGGVDSSVALHLMHRQGHELEAFYLKVWLEDELEYLGQCPWEEDLEYIEKICRPLGIPLHVVPIQQDYWQRVIAHSLEEIRAGRTPNPDMLCNSRIKFGAFLDQIDSAFDKVVTGHYAATIQKDGITFLKRVADPIKDQTYFLAHLTQEQLSRAHFPIGAYVKSEIRQMAQDWQLPNQDRPDSQGLCFLGKIRFRDFVRHHMGEKPGPYINLDTGETVGEHQGYWFYTIGQRHGLGLSHGPWFVAGRDIAQNIIYISNTYYDPGKERRELWVGRLNWLSGYHPQKESMQVKLRHGPKIHDCEIEPQGDRLFVRLRANDQGIAAGQYAVFYQEGICLGCGMILEDQIKDLTV
ncbi:MAG: tRNA 2-thiouridine(34) synthase MnmA [Leptospiraceae bacterium]|nr:tRNA 2-thiouridine(34) synthase MnmA [Leptospiraceae bacterium]